MINYYHVDVVNTSRVFGPSGFQGYGLSLAFASSRGRLGGDLFLARFFLFWPELTLLALIWRWQKSDGHIYANLQGIFVIGTWRRVAYE